MCKSNFLANTFHLAPFQNVNPILFQKSDFMLWLSSDKDEKGEIMQHFDLGLSKGTPHREKMFSFGHCPNEEGGEAPARIKKKHNIYINF